MHAIRTCLMVMSGALVMLVALLDHGLAQIRQNHSSFLTPFPDGDVYKTLVIGDWLAAGLHGGLAQGFAEDRRVDLSANRIDFRGVMRGELEGGLQTLQTELAQSRYSVAIVLLGSFDRIPIRAGGAREAVGSEGWNAVFGDRIEEVMKTLRQAGVAVYWIGLPIMQGDQRNQDVRAINEVLRQRAYRNGVRYVDVYTAVATDDGEYSAYGPDLTGTVRLLRYKDGVHFTRAGYAQLAHFIERQLRRDLDEARSERDVPLAGDAREMKRVAALAKATSGPRGPGSGKGDLDAASSEGGVRAVSGAGAAAGGAPAEDATLMLSERGAGGRIQRTPVDLARPAIAGSVVAVLTRGQSEERSARLGLTISDELPNGLLVLRTITPSSAATGDGNRLPASQLPFFRVLVKGERLTPVAGRADDVRWPREDALPATPPRPTTAALLLPPQPQTTLPPGWDSSLPPLPRRKPVPPEARSTFSPLLE